MATLAPSVTHRDPKGRKFFSVGEAAYDKAGLSEEEAQRVSEAPGFGDLVGKFIAEHRVTDRFKNEEVKSSYTYPPEYKGPKPILEQVRALQAIFPQLDVTETLGFIAQVLPELRLPAGAEGWFAIPRWHKIADSYNAAVELVLDKIAASGRSFHNYRQGELGSDRLRLHPHTSAMWEQIERQQQGDILIVPAQYGMRHRGRSVRRAREVIRRNPIEFGFDPFAGGCMALVHPERYVRSSELDTDFPGAEYDFPGDVARWSYAPCLRFFGRLGFGTGHVGHARGFYGSVSGFLPQSNLESSGS